VAIISLNAVRKSFGGFQILDEVNLIIGNNEKVALVGPNGSGKTTILRLITGQDEPDSGSIQILPGTTIGLMTQDTELVGGSNLLEEVSNASTEIKHLEREMTRIEHAMTAADPDDMDELLAEYGEVQHEFDRLGGYSFDAELKSTLSGLGLGPDHWEKPVGVLSGGQKTRAALAKLLLQKPDVLLLDEPTNHLDIEACEWLEDFLQDFPGAVLVVSHDRYFLDKVASKIVDLDQGCTHSYPGNYTSYTKQKEEILRQQLEDYERQKQEISKLEDFVQRYHAGQRHQEAKSREKKLAKMVRLRKPKIDAPKIRLKIDQAVVSGNIIMDLQGVGKAFGDEPLFTGLDMIVQKGDRIGLVGPNGAGKTTLLKMILGDEDPTMGTISLGYGLEIGYFAQDLGGLDPDNTVLEEILDFADLMPGEARSLLAKFLFKGDDVFKSVSKLSGGERNRLVLAKLMLTKPNILVLDEPTNHLDIPSRQALDQALKDFDGTVILTSHDRYLLNSVATRILELAKGSAKVYEGNYDFFVERARRSQPRPVKKKPKPAAKAPFVNNVKKGPTAADIEREIETAESRMQELTDLLGNPETYADADTATSTLAEYNALLPQIEQLYADWEARLAETN
jgi:ATP-binding cassette subfamily F protein 3